MPLFAIPYPTPYSLLSGGVLGEAVAYVGGDALLDKAADEAGERCGDGDQDPQEGREDEAGDGYGLKRDRDDMRLVDMDAQGTDMGDELKPMDDDGGEEKGCDGERADGDEQDVDGAGYMLAAAAVGAIGEMLVVVRAHGRGEARDVVTPAREDIANDLIDAGGMPCAAIGGKS